MSRRRAAIASRGLVVRAPVGHGGVKMQVGGISGDVQMDDIRHFNAYRSTAVVAIAMDFDVIAGDGKVELSGLLEHGLANGIFALHVIGAEERFSLNSVSKLVVFVIGRDQLNAQEERHRHHKQSEEKL